MNMDGYDQVIQEKDNTIGQLRETIEILELKIKKLEQLVKLKDSKIGNLTNKLNSMGIIWASHAASHHEARASFLIGPPPTF